MNQSERDIRKVLFTSLANTKYIYICIVNEYMYMSPAANMDAAAYNN